MVLVQDILRIKVAQPLLSVPIWATSWRCFTTTKKFKMQKLHFTSMHNHHLVSQLVVLRTVYIAAILEDSDLILYYKTL